MTMEPPALYGVCDVLLLCFFRGDRSCLGGFAQHGEFGFRFADAAYTEDSAYREAKRGYTGIKMPFGGNETEGGFNQF